jgi:hypothetical protein
MKRFSYLSLLVIVLFTACSGVSAPPTETATPVRPTDTQPPPTDTPEPTPTFTQTPTSTPNATATAAAQATQSAASVLSELDVLLAESDVPYKEGHLLWQQTESLSIDMSGPQDDNFRELSGNPSVGNFIFKSDVTWNASGIIICGAIFRSEPDLEKGKQYQFYFYRLSGLPAYFIDVYEFDNFKNTITDARFSDELDVSNNAINQFVLVAQDNQFNVYLNGKRQSRYFDDSKQRSEGIFAFLAWQDSGQGSCKFENSWIWALN